MRAIGYADAGPERLLTFLDLPVPTPGPGEVLIAMAAIGVGLHDRWFLPTEPTYPYPIGIEGSGTVDEVGPGVTGHRPGERVLFTSSRQPKGGTWAEYAVVAADALIPVPEGLGLVEAAAVPVAGRAALESLHGLDATSGETVFVAGASGAIGTFVVQLLVARGARVAASASAANADHLHSLGVELAVDYRAGGWADQVRQWAGGGVDAALAIPFGTGADCLPVVRDGGRLVTVSNDELTSVRGITVTQIGHRRETDAELADLAADIADGRIRLVVERVHPFDGAVAALAKTETRHARGKSVIAL